jgi:pimeloyl-ACP methyl ester carboxylesterase
MTTKTFHEEKRILPEHTGSFPAGMATVLYLLIVLLVLNSCDITEKRPDEDLSYLSDYTLIGEMSPGQIISSYDHPIVEIITEHTVRAYRINYRTQTVSGADITASGLILVPSVSSPPVMVLQRGTLFRKQEAPSLFNPAIEDDNSGWTYFAPPVSSSGYILLMPDLIGFGASAQHFHPYIVTRSHGRVSLDMMRAAEEFFELENIIKGNRLFISGYSQGATSAMALIKIITEEAPDEFTVTAGSMGGGAYNLVDLSKRILSADTLGFPPYYAFMVAGYDQTYGLERPMSSIFKSPYSSRIYGENLFGGHLSGNEIADRLTNITSDLFQEEFITAFLGDGEKELKALLNENDVSQFATGIPIRMYHGESDEAVPVEEAYRSFENLKAAGTENIEFFLIPGGTHQSSAIDFASQSLNWFFLL